MDSPILEILQKAKDSESGHLMSKSKDLAQDVETYAPGYLDMEKEGRGAEYDLDELLEIFEEDGILPTKPNDWIDSMRAGASRAE